MYRPPKSPKHHTFAPKAFPPPLTIAAPPLDPSVVPFAFSLFAAGSSVAIGREAAAFRLFARASSAATLAAGGPAVFSTQATTAVPTTKPSAPRSTTRLTFSGLEIPNPTATGMSECFLMNEMVLPSSAVAAVKGSTRAFSFPPSPPPRHTPPTAPKAIHVSPRELRTSRADPPGRRQTRRLPHTNQSTTLHPDGIQSASSGRDPPDPPADPPRGSRLCCLSVCGCRGGGTTAATATAGLGTATVTG
mmetsp:Transcript_38445/g.75481  ORF Transcript_38445/g.75481 Transcript_38445/m.75481 type:complete len:247 (-) Transcript_38445:722-1462(-)